MKKIWKQTLASVLVFSLILGCIPLGNNRIVNASDAEATNATDETLKFGDSDTYLQLSDPLSAAPQAVEATVNMPEISKEWLLCAADEITYSNGTQAETIQTVGAEVNIGPVAGTKYAQVALTNSQAILFSKTFDIQVPYVYSNEDMALSFWMYSDTAATIDNGYIELTSSGTADKYEMCWGFNTAQSGNVTLNAGWNYLELPVSKMINGTTSDRGFNLQEVNFIRWHGTKFSSITEDSTITIGLTDVKLIVQEENVKEVGVLTTAENLAASGKSVVKRTSVMDGDEAIMIEYHDTTSVLSGTQYRVDYNNKALNAIDLSAYSDWSNLAIEFWMKSSDTTMTKLPSNTIFYIGTSSDTYGAATGLYYDAGQIQSAITLNAGEWTKVTLNLGEAKQDSSKLTPATTTFTWLRFLVYQMDTAGTTFSISGMKIVDTTEENVTEEGVVGILTTAESLSAAGKSEIKTTTVMDGSEAITIEYHDTASVQSGTQYRVDYNNQALNAIHLSTYSDWSNLAIEFWMKSSDANMTKLPSSTIFYIGTSSDNYGAATGLYYDAGQIQSAITLNAGEWTKVTLNLGEAKQDSSKLIPATTTFTWLRFLVYQMDTAGTTFSISGMKIVDTTEKEVLTTAENLSATGKSEIKTTTVMDGSEAITIEYHDTASVLSGTQYRVDYNNKALNAIDLSAYSDWSNLAIEFWMKSSDTTMTKLPSNTIFYIGTDTTKYSSEPMLHYNSTMVQNAITLTAGEWTKVTLNLGEATNTSQLIPSTTTFTWLRFLVYNMDTAGTTFSISGMKIVDLSETVEVSDYDATVSNYQIFSNLNAETETNSSALIVTEDGYPSFVFGNKQYTLQQNICTDEDVDLKVVRAANGKIKFFVNQALMGVSSTTSSDIGTPVTEHCIGGDATGKQIMNGSISNLKVYSDAACTTCIGNWALSGDIQNVLKTMPDSSGKGNTAVFRGSRADDWSDYTVPTEMNRIVGTMLSAAEFSYDATNGGKLSEKQETIIQGEAVHYVEETVYHTDKRIDISKNSFGSLDYSGYDVEDLALEFWMKATVDQEITLNGTNVWQSLRIGSGEYCKEPMVSLIGTISLKANEWSKVTLNLKDANITGDWTPSSGIKWMRFLVNGLTEGATFSVSDMKIVKAGNAEPWSLVYVPDMENLTSSDTNSETWNDMAEWISENVEAENIQHVIAAGDTTSDNSAEAYNRAWTGFEQFKDQVSWSNMIGCHDYAESVTNRDSAKYQTYFGENAIKASKAGSTYSGCYVDAENKNSTENAYYRFDVNGVKWMVLQLEYCPREEVLTWADGVLKDYPLDNVILATHGYVDGYGNYITNVNGTSPKMDTMWTELKDNTNIKLILSGHGTNGTGAIVQKTETNSNEETVPVLMMNAQDLDAGDNAYYTDRPLGMLSILRFSADGTEVAVQYYSPTEGKSFSPADPWGNENSNNITLTVAPEVCTPVIKTYTEFEPKIAPTDIPDGYVFAGWFTDNTCTKAITDANKSQYPQAIAKFVDAEILSVKAQVRLNKTNDGLPSEKTDMRFITSVDSEYYQTVGFLITANGKTVDTATLPNVDPSQVYEKLYAVGMAGTDGVTPESYTASEIFSPQSIWFKAFTITSIKEAQYEAEFKVQPYWITMDGTIVKGEEVVKKVVDGTP